MPSSSSIPGLPGLKSHDITPPDLGPLLRHSSRAKGTVGEFGEACYALGGVDGYILGTTHGTAIGHAAGFFEASQLLCASFGVVTFLVLIIASRFVRLVKR